MKKEILALMFLIFIVFFSFSEVIELNDGSVHKGKILSMNENNITIKTDYGSLVIDRNKIKKIYYTDSDYNENDFCIVSIRLKEILQQHGAANFKKFRYVCNINDEKYEYYTNEVPINTTRNNEMRLFETKIKKNSNFILSVIIYHEDKDGVEVEVKKDTFSSTVSSNLILEINVNGYVKASPLGLLYRYAELNLSITVL
jgi:hypothetical protein